jgi:hypothetical protein
VRQLIKFVKRLDDFRALCQEDQITALKGLWELRQFRYKW